MTGSARARAEAWELRAKYATLLGVPDGGRYLNDWTARVDALLAELDGTREALDRETHALHEEIAKVRAELDARTAALQDAREALGAVCAGFDAYYARPGPRRIEPLLNAEHLARAALARLDGGREPGGEAE